jgi:hypothetical protein
MYGWGVGGGEWEGTLSASGCSVCCEALASCEGGRPREVRRESKVGLSWMKMHRTASLSSRLCTSCNEMLALDASHLRIYLDTHPAFVADLACCSSF